MTERSRLQGWHPESEFLSLLNQVKDILDHPHVERNMLMAIQADVQKLIDEIAQNKDYVKSMIQAQQVQGKQIDDLKAQIAGWQAGQVLTIEDLNAIKNAVTDLGDTNTAIQTATPANTPEGPAVPAATPTPDVPPAPTPAP